MHISGLLPLSFIPLLFQHALCLPSQDPLLLSHAHVPTANNAPTTLIDVLSLSSNHTLLMRLLQRTKLIPALNTLNNSAFFAPDNDAIMREVMSLRADGPTKSLWEAALWEADEGGGDGRDNIQYALRQHILYHLVPLPAYFASPRPPLSFPASAPNSHETFYYPRKQISPPSPAPAPSPPWLPLPGGTLAGVPQRMRVIDQGGEKRIGVDWRGQGGTLVVPLSDATNGEVWSVESIVPLPEDLGNVTLHSPSLSFLTSQMPRSLLEPLSTTANLSVFLPSDTAFASLTSLELAWLRSNFSEGDWTAIRNAHVAQNVDEDVGGGVAWVDRLSDGAEWNISMWDGSSVSVKREGGEVKASDVALEERDIYASNGVLHTVSSFLLPTSRLALTPEKTLVALNATRFVRLLRAANLTRYVDGSSSDSQEWTVLAPPDDALDPHSLIFDPPDDDDGDGDGDGGERERRRAAYHVLAGKLRKEELEDGVLVQTELREVGLGGVRQRLRVGVGAGQGGLAWGDARVLGEPVETSNVLIYFISHYLTPPPSSLTLITSRPQLSTFTTSLYATKLNNLLVRTPNTTLLAPLNSAWESAGLVGDWLLSASKTAREDLSRVAKTHILTDVLYAADVGAERYHETLEGGVVGVGHVGANGSSIGVRVPEGGGQEGRFVLREGEQDVGRDGLTRTGVVHEVDTLLVPRSVHVTLGKMARGARAEVMLGLLGRAGFGWVLDGTQPPFTNGSESEMWSIYDDDDDDDEDIILPSFPNVPYTLLLPTDAAFSSVNLTALLRSRKSLLQLLQQHLIPTRNPPPSARGGPPLPLSDGGNFPTLLSPTNSNGGVVFHTDDDYESTPSRIPDGSTSGWLVSIQGLRGSSARAASARVIRWGRATPGPAGIAAGGGVLLIDRVLEPYKPGWWARFGPPVLTGALGGIVIALFWLFVVWLWRRNGKAVPYEVLEGEED